MVFSSVPAYNLDTSNWQQLPNHQLMNTGLGNSGHFFPPPAPPSAQQLHGPGNSIRPGLMTERARLANIPMPEASLKCPRCESTNTKFCYFNNYSLSQPRHFCKTCRRYWTRGGALRNVPVGGGCRRNNKKSNNKSNSNRSKSPATGDCQTGGVASANTTNVPSSGSGGGSSAGAMLGLSGPVSQQLRFMPPNLVHHLGDNFGIGGEINGWINNYGEIISPFGGAGNSNFHASGHLGSSSSVFFGGSDHHSMGFYPFEGGFTESGLNGGTIRVGEKVLGSGLLHRASVKLEDNQELNLSSARFRGMTGNEQHGLSGAGSAWTDRSAGSLTSNNAV